jgi:hypothetical protein
MVQVVIVVREPGDLETNDTFEFDLPEVPAIGSYISIRELDMRDPYGKDLVVRRVWWRLKHAAPGATSAGSLIEIFVECDPATGPYSSERWRAALERARARGIEIEEFEVSRRPPLF